jgi:hypothetical protein
MGTLFVPTDPVTAKAIALHTEGVLARMRGCEAIKPLEEIYTGFLSYAKSQSVCEQIREHVQTAFTETATLIKAREKAARVVRDPTGERE